MEYIIATKTISGLFSITMDKATTNKERIWRTVLSIPEGKVAAYGKVADLAGLPGRARYVSRAMSLAPKEFKLPWYRVIRSNGTLAFKPDSQMANKQNSLLKKEGVIVENNRVDLVIYEWKPDLGEILAKLDF